MQKKHKKNKEEKNSNIRDESERKLIRSLCNHKYPSKNSIKALQQYDSTDSHPGSNKGERESLQ